MIYFLFNIIASVLWLGMALFTKRGRDLVYGFVVLTLTYWTLLYLPQLLINGG
jgi:hypothetical protein